MHPIWDWGHAWGILAFSGFCALCLVATALVIWLDDRKMRRRR